MEQNAQWNLERLRKRSQLLLGSRHRLPLLVLTASRPQSELYGARIASLAGVGRKEAMRVLTDLEVAGLLKPGPKLMRGGRGRPARGLERVEDPAWEIFLALAAPTEQ